MEQQGLVHIVDDDLSIQRALDSLLRSVGLEARSYGSCGEFLATKMPAQPSCLILDVRLPGVSGLDFQSQMASHGISLPVILMTGHGDIPMSVKAMKAGAVDFLTKPFRDQDLLDAVTTAIERDTAAREEEGQLQAIIDLYDALTEREQQVMDLVTMGRLNKQAAFDLGLSEITVKIYRASAMKRMQARTLPDLVKMAEALRAVGHLRPVTPGEA
ncbi:response regulator transcription factor [Aurantiacibacter hainanensis]|uniref:response regulator transcription factor n=1 Tax=Aurantiacibacter hainanensis TaxID=3076114 RepID=UPI0030C6B9F8